MSIPPITKSCIARHDSRDDLLFSKAWYIDDFRDCLDTRRFGAMRLSGDAQTISRDWHGNERDTAARPRTKSCWPWGGYGTSELAVTFKLGLAVCSLIQRSRI